MWSHFSLTLVTLDYDSESEEIETEIWFVMGDILKEYANFGDRLVDVSFLLGGIFWGVFVLGRGCCFITFHFLSMYLSRLEHHIQRIVY